MLVICLLLLLNEPAQVGSLLQKGLLALQSGRLQEARQQLEQVSRLDPGNPYVWTSLAETYRRLKDSRRALAAAKSAEKAGSQDPVVCHALAMFYSESGEIGTAARLEARFAESSKSDAEAQARAASLYLEAAEPATAVGLARKAVDRQPSAAHENLLGRALVASGQVPEAVQHLQRAAALAPADPTIAFDYTQVLLQKEDFGGAVHTLEPALAAHPEDAQLVLATGVARYGQRRFDDCAGLFLRVIKLDPKIEQPYEFLGKMMDQAHSYLPEITAAFRTWTKREPQNAKATFLLAKAILTTGGDKQEAETLLRQSISIDKGRWESHYELGVLELNTRRYQDALAELIQSTDLNPKEPTAHYQLARVYDRLGQPEKAEAERAIHGKLTARP